MLCLHHIIVPCEVKSLSRVWLFATPWTVAHQAPASMGFSRQEYWSGLPFPSPGDHSPLNVLLKLVFYWGSLQLYPSGILACNFLFLWCLCPAFCNPMDCSLPSLSVHGILQTRILEWVTISFSRGSSWLRDWTQISCIAGGLFAIIWATREVLIYHLALIWF